MKKLLLLILLSPAFSFAQHSYGALTAVNLNYAHSDPAFGGLFTVGWKYKDLGIGAGAGLINLPYNNNGSSAYIPVFGEIAFFSGRRKTRPFFNVQVGYGIYQNSINTYYASLDESGGLYYRANLGLLFPLKHRRDILLSAGYVNSTFTVSDYDYKNSSYADGWAVNFGVKF